MRGLWVLLVLAGCSQVIGISEPRDFQLSSLQVRLGNSDPLPLEPEFDPEQTGYSVRLPAVNRIRVLATTDDPEVSITRGDDSGFGSVESTVDVRPGSSDPVTITLEALGSTRDFTVTPIVGGIDYTLPTIAFGPPVQSLAALAPKPGDPPGIVVLEPTGVVHPFYGTQFTVQPTINVSNGVALATGDFNNDNADDVVVVTGTGASVIANNGDGSFKAPQTIAAGSSMTSLAIGDLSGDTTPDLVLSDTNNVIVQNSDGDNTFTAGATPAVTMPRAVAIGPFDATAGNDIAVADNTQHVVVLRNDGSGNFSPIEVALGAQGRAVATGDLDGDGVADVAVLTNEVAVVTKLSGAPQIQNISLPAAGAALAVADLDADGNDDIVVITIAGPTVFFGDGNGGFNSFDYTFELSNPCCVVLADFNNDGRLDIVVGSDSGTVVFGSIRA